MAKLGLTRGLKTLQSWASWAAFSRRSLSELLSASKLVVVVGSSVPLLAIGGLGSAAYWLSAPSFLPPTGSIDHSQGGCFSKASRSLQSAQMEAYIR